MNPNWETWIWGGVIALIGAGLSGLVTWGTMPDNVTTKQIIISCVVPAAFTFYAWLKQSPPPWDGVNRRSSVPPPPKPPEVKP